MEIASMSCDSRKLGDHTVGLGNGMQYMATDAKVKSLVRRFELEDALVRECQTLRQSRIAITGDLQM